jgi:DNA-binding NtrC family response regulator
MSVTNDNYGTWSAAQSDDPRFKIRRLDELEREMILFAVEACQGNMTEVALRLGIGRSSLYRKLRHQDRGPAKPPRDAAGLPQVPDAKRARPQ